MTPTFTVNMTLHHPVKYRLWQKTGFLGDQCIRPFEIKIEWSRSHSAVNQAQATWWV